MSVFPTALISLLAGWDRGHLRATAFLQERRSHRVLGAASMLLAAP